MKKILVIEDEMFVRFLYKETLSKIYAIDEAADGFTAMDKLESGVYDIALVDLNIPMMNGMEILRKIKEKGMTVKSIVISAYGMDDKKEQAFALGAVDYMVKPIDIDELKEKIEKWC